MYWPSRESLGVPLSATKPRMDEHLKEAADGAVLVAPAVTTNPEAPSSPAPDGEVGGAHLALNFRDAETSGGTPPLMRLRGFHPGWLGAVMGTGIIGVAASLNPGGIA